MAHDGHEATGHDDHERRGFIKSISEVAWFDEPPITRDLNRVQEGCARFGLAPVATPHAFAVETGRSANGKHIFTCHYDHWGRVVQTDSINPSESGPNSGTTTTYEFNGLELSLVIQYGSATRTPTYMWNRQNWATGGEPLTTAAEPTSTARK